MNYSLVFGLALFSLSVSSYAFVPIDPGIDCTKTTTPVEEALCNATDYGMEELDNTMAELYKAVSKSPGVDAVALKKSQQAWLAKRNKCHGSGGQVASCLFESYRARYIELSSGYDQQHLTGTFSKKSWFIDSVLLPRGKLAVSISTDRSVPTYDSCLISFITPLKGTSAKYTFAPVVAGKDEKCTINMNVTGSRIDVSSTGCRSSCGHTVPFDGTYEK